MAFLFPSSQKTVLPLQYRRLIKIGITFCICFTLLLLMSTNAFAYALNGGKWSSSRISINFSTSMQSYDKQGWIDGYTAWNNANTHIRFSANGGALIVHDTYRSDVTWDGITYYSINAFGYFTGVDTYLNYYYTQGYSRGTIQQVAAHELGHSVGLDHVNTCVLMNPVTGSRCGDIPRQDDINGVNHLY